MTYNAKIQLFDPLVGGVKWHDRRKKTKTYSDSTYQTTVENARVYKKILFLDKNHVLVPPIIGVGAVL